MNAVAEKGLTLQITYSTVCAKLTVMEVKNLRHNHTALRAFGILCASGNCPIQGPTKSLRKSAIKVPVTLSGSDR